MKTFLFGFVLFFLSACATIQQPEVVSVNGVSDFKMSSGKILFTISAEVMNPNGHRFKLFPSQLDVIINGKKLGQLSNPEKHILKRKKTTSVSVPLVAETEKGALLRLATLALKDSVEVQFFGDITAGFSIFRKKVPLNESFKTSTRFLKLNN
jgi:hypothetical protein